MSPPQRSEAASEELAAPDDPHLASAREALARAQDRLQQTAALYFAAAPVGLAEARQAYYDALTEHAEAEQRLVHARLRRLR